MKSWKQVDLSKWVPIRLLSCPFCSGQPEVLENEEGQAIVRCKGCGCRTDIADTYQDAMSVWRSRTMPREYILDGKQNIINIY